MSSNVPTLPASEICERCGMPFDDHDLKFSPPLCPPSRKHYR